MIYPCSLSSFQIIGESLQSDLSCSFRNHLDKKRAYVVLISFKEVETIAQLGRHPTIMNPTLVTYQVAL